MAEFRKSYRTSQQAPIFSFLESSRWKVLQHMTSFFGRMAHLLLRSRRNHDDDHAIARLRQCFRIWSSWQQRSLNVVRVGIPAISYSPRFANDEIHSKLPYLGVASVLYLYCCIGLCLCAPSAESTFPNRCAYRGDKQNVSNRLSNATRTKHTPCGARTHDLWLIRPSL